MKYRLLLTLLCLLAVPVLAYGQATINVQDASTIEWGTTTIDVTVSAVPPPGVTDIQGTITFNSSIVHVIDIVGLNGFSGFFFKAIDNVLGTVTFTGAIVGGPGVTAGDILQLTVEAVGAPGESCFVDLALPISLTTRTDGSLDGTGPSGTEGSASFKTPRTSMSMEEHILLPLL